MSNEIVILTSLLGGWIVLWPARRHFESVEWVLMGLPIGIFGWVTVALVSAIARQQYSALVVALGWATFIIIGSLTFHTASRETDSKSPSQRWRHAGRVAAAAAFIAIAMWLAREGNSVFAQDSIYHYEPLGAFLSVTGEIPIPIMTDRMVLVPAVHAAGRFLGGSWHHLLYPMSALVCIALILSTTYRFTRQSSVGRFSLLIAAPFVVLLTRDPQFRAIAHLVHSNVVTTLYLTASVVCVMVAYLYADTSPAPIDDTKPAPMRRVWLTAAGIVASGIVLTRPDGFAYVVIPIALVAISQANAPRQGAVLWFFAPLVLLSSSFVFLYIVRHGVWHGDSKLDGRYALAFIAFQVVAAFFSWALGRFAVRIRSSTTIAVILCLIPLTIFSLFVLETGRAIKAAYMMFTNLVRDGGWDLFWMYTFFASSICLVTAPIFKHEWLRALFFTIVLFFSISFLVHGSHHPGRLAWMDSFNRLSFHIVPVIFLFITGSAIVTVSEVVQAVIDWRKTKTIK